MTGTFNNTFLSELEPSEFYLSQNYPNPFKDTTKIKYCVANRTKVLITVYDSDNEDVETLVNEIKDPGTYEVEFSASACHSGEARNLSDGYYYYRMIANEYLSEKKWFCINHLFGRLSMKMLLQFLS